MTYTNKSSYWGDVDIEVTPQWYGERAVALGVEFPEVVITRVGLVIDGVVVATPVVEDTQQPE